MEWIFYAVFYPIALLISASAVYALNWALKKGELRDFEEQAKSIFDDEEPIGEQTDFFPGHKPDPRSHVHHPSH